MSFWQEFKKPIIGLSPMDGISDMAFREITHRYSKPDLIYTEFESVDALLHAPIGILGKLIYSNEQPPIIAQFFGIEPLLFKYAAFIAIELGFNGVDVNMGCPSKNVAQRGAGAGLIKNPILAKEILENVKQGLYASLNEEEMNLPQAMKEKLELTKKHLLENGVSISKKTNAGFSFKTRIGYEQEELNSFLPQLITANPDAIAIHGRTYKQMYSGYADWKAIAKASDIVKSYNANITFLGNGDIRNKEQAVQYSQEYKVDGVLIGRGFLGKPWALSNTTPDIKETFKIMVEHAKEHEKYNPGKILPLRKHLAWYISGIEGASELRSQLVRVENITEVEKILNQYLDKVEYSK
ncbi:MAG TPA: tRNA-dihydrouridine synthase [Candidatus Dojkabacteria bacterium]|nr:tRNA-dihydrouridine synthase [Candidatus Dojkabacteria bacterium]